MRCKEETKQGKTSKPGFMGGDIEVLMNNIPAMLCGLPQISPMREAMLAITDSVNLPLSWSLSKDTKCDDWDQVSRTHGFTVCIIT